MADAKALFRRHLKQFSDLIFGDQGYVPDRKEMAIIYAACIIAESVRNDLENFEVETPG